MSAKPRAHDPRRLDVAAFAAQGGELEGHWPLAGFERLLDDRPVRIDAGRPPDDSTASGAPGPTSDVTWRARGERRAVAVGAPQLWLHLEADAVVQRRCQRCLQPVELALQVRRALRFVDGEALAAELDADSDDDVLALERALDLHALVEDELLLALPMVPRHEHCAAPAAGTAPADTDAAAPHPFAALARWPRGTDP
ncbi:DUF177 domain-containing protein [Azohydromonas sp.]|uniref:YceD family protein n=1 Tax=Azohydromonas sp. TaxID=1872666 RepID=UPI002C91F0E4|nr:DUF177 domain-containing protein [Azohydromonas sp.]HMM85566.1 DUF177 domain-containing protein [Azohydromonas sp.]